MPTIKDNNNLNISTNSEHKEQNTNNITDETVDRLVKNMPHLSPDLIDILNITIQQIDSIYMLCNDETLKIYKKKIEEIITSNNK